MTASKLQKMLNTVRKLDQPDTIAEALLYRAELLLQDVEQSKDQRSDWWNSYDIWLREYKAWKLSKSQQ
jgi:hypothetical protein